MRFRIRRLVLSALGATCIVSVILNVLRPHDVDLTVPLMDVEQKPLRVISLDERLAKYSSAARRNVTADIEQSILRPDVGLFTTKRRPTPPTSSPPNGDAEEGDPLMSETVSGSENERLRRQYVELPEQSRGADTFWWINSDADPDDRILAQMRHVPRQYRRDGQKLKTIYMPGGLGNEPEGQEKFVSEQCPVDTCRLTADRSVAVTAEMRLLQSDAVFQFVEKPKDQIWVMFLLESPANTGEFQHAKDLINWTATYRWDSTIVTPYEKFVPYRNASRQRHGAKRRRTPLPGVFDSELNVTRRNYAAGKTKMVAWFVSNCGPKNKRNDYARELAKYVQVDVYGGCGTMTCLRSDSDRCRTLLNDDYKFYLSLENSNCDYYITEKFYENGLRNDIVPIVMGGRKEDYLRAAPPHSYIHVEDFASAKDLAKYLHRLDQSDALYNEYLAWKGTGEFINTKFWCRLCAMLHDQDKPIIWYNDFEKWWSPKGACRIDRWDRTAASPGPGAVTSS